MQTICWISEIWVVVLKPKNDLGTWASYMAPLWLSSLYSVSALSAGGCGFDPQVDLIIPKTFEMFNHFSFNWFLVLQR